MSSNEKAIIEKNSNFDSTKKSEAVYVRERGIIRILSFEINCFYAASFKGFKVLQNQQFHARIC